MKFVTIKPEVIKKEKAVCCIRGLFIDGVLTDDAALKEFNNRSGNNCKIDDVNIYDPI